MQFCPVDLERGKRGVGISRSDIIMAWGELLEKILVHVADKIAKFAACGRNPEILKSVLQFITLLQQGHINCSLTLTTYPVYNTVARQGGIFMILI